METKVDRLSEGDPQPLRPPSTKEVPPRLLRRSVKYEETPSRRDATSTPLLLEPETGPRVSLGISNDMDQG
jgi:hypothetical protein